MPLPPWTPELSALDLLLSVARLGSVGRAAAEHGISQPSASARLSRLERRLGVELLRRSTRGSELTPAGEAVVAWAHGVVGAAQALADGVTALRADRRAHLTVAASLTVAEYLLPSWLLVLRRHDPDLDVSVRVANSSEVCEAVRGGRADVGFVESPTVPRDLSKRRVGTDRLALVVAADYPLATRAARGIARRDLLTAPLLLREPGSGTRDTFLHALGTPPPELPHAIALGSTATIVATVRAGGGIGVISERAVAGDLASGALVRLAVADLDLDRPLHAVWQGRQPSDAARDLVRIAIAATSRAG